MREHIPGTTDDVCASRTLSVPWALTVAILAVLAFGGFAQAQHPLSAPGAIQPPDPTATYVQYHRPEHDWVAMQRMPRRRPVRPAVYPDTEAEIRRLRAQIDMIERRLANKDRPAEEEPRWDGPVMRVRAETDARIEDLNRHREELTEQARHREMELEELHQHMGNRQRDIDDELRGIREEMDELMRRREELAEQAHRREMEMEELRAQTERRQNEIRMELQNIHERMKAVEEELARIERERQERRRRLLDEVRGQTEALRDQLRALHHRAERLQRALDELGHDDGEAMELRRALEETREQIRWIEMQLGRPAGRPAPPMKRWPACPPPQPDGACAELARELEETRAELREMQAAEKETLEAIRLELNEVRETTLKLRPPGCGLILCDHPNTVGSAGQNWYVHYWY